MENPIVKVEHLYHRYTATRWAIEDIDFEIEVNGGHWFAWVQWCGKVNDNEYYLWRVETDSG